MVFVGLVHMSSSKETDTANERIGSASYVMVKLPPVIHSNLDHVLTELCSFR